MALAQQLPPYADFQPAPSGSQQASSDFQQAPSGFQQYPGMTGGFLPYTYVVVATCFCEMRVV